jgi:hypothetical protein
MSEREMTGTTTITSIVEETKPDPERNTMAWMERCFPDLAADVRSGKSSFSEAHLEAVRRSLNATSEL